MGNSPDSRLDAQEANLTTFKQFVLIELAIIKSELLALQETKKDEDIEQARIVASATFVRTLTRLQRKLNQFSSTSEVL